MSESLFNKVLSLRPATLLRKRLWHRCSPVNFVIISKNIFFAEQLCTTASTIRVFDWKTRFEIFMFRFCLYLKASNNWLLFSCLMCFNFEFLMLSYVFYFHKKMGNEIQFIFCFSFSWRNWKMNYLKKSRSALWLFSQVWRTRHLRAGSCQVHWYFPLKNCYADTRNLHYWLLISY